MDLNKNEIVDRMAAAAGITKKAAEHALGGLVEAVGDALESGGTASLPGFGSWSVNTRKAMIGRNPKTGEKLSIPETRSPGFKAGGKLKERVR